ncbi:MAG: DUF3108 domain-containing protein [Candidatus Omnitrophica bacterium]|nr:DUF3108 domain-containing protein [Candidatus Omnitrophota bacterium]
MKPIKKFKIESLEILLIIFLIIVEILVIYKFRDYYWGLFLKGFGSSHAKLKSFMPQPQSVPFPFKDGEALVFRIDMGFFPVGKARLTFEGKTKLKGQEVYLIKFSTNTANFKDTETIYAELDTFLPLRVERNINLWGVASKIVEEYDQKEKYVKITKTELGKTSEQTIKSDSEIHNVICMIYHYRLAGNIELGKKVAINLPLKKITIEAKEIRKVKLPKGKFEAFILESVPAGYDLWFDIGPKKMPLKITGAITFGNAALVLSDFNYSPSH